MRAFCRIAILVVGGLLGVACGRERAPSTGEDTAQSIPVVPGAEVPPPPATPWSSAVGRVLALSMSEYVDSAMILEPTYVEGRYTGAVEVDVRPLTGVQVDLFSRSSLIGTAELRGGIYHPYPEGCTSWPSVFITAPRGGWNVGLESGRATVIPLDSLEGMKASDSSRFVAQITRLISMRVETKDTMFSSVPFLVVRGYRFRTASIDGVIAVVQRSIPSEADPREERVLFIAERSSGSSGDYQIAYLDREVGGIEAPRSIDIAAAVMLNASQRAALIIHYLYNDGGSVGFVERTAPGKWEATWESAYVGC
jgi:hypothetical protein